MALDINGLTVSGGGNFTVTNSSSTNFFGSVNNQQLDERAVYYNGTTLANSAWKMTKSVRRGGTNYYTAARYMDNGGQPGYTRDLFVITPSHGWVNYHVQFRIYSFGYQGPGYAQYILDGTGGDYTGVIRTYISGVGGIQLTSPSLRTNTPQAGPNNYYDGDSRVLETVQMSMPSWTGGLVEVEWSDNFNLVSSIQTPANWQIELKG